MFRGLMATEVKIAAVYLGWQQVRIFDSSLRSE